MATLNKAYISNSYRIRCSRISEVSHGSMATPTEDIEEKRKTNCPNHVLQAIYGKVPNKTEAYEKSLHRSMPLIRIKMALAMSIMSFTLHVGHLGLRTTGRANSLLLCSLSRLLRFITFTKKIPSADLRDWFGAEMNVYMYLQISSTLPTQPLSYRVLYQVMGPGLSLIIT